MFRVRWISSATFSLRMRVCARQFCSHPHTSTSSQSLCSSNLSRADSSLSSKLQEALCKQGNTSILHSVHTETHLTAVATLLRMHEDDLVQLFAQHCDLVAVPIHKWQAVVDELTSLHVSLSLVPVLAAMNTKIFDSPQNIGLIGSVVRSNGVLEEAFEQVIGQCPEILSLNPSNLAALLTNLQNFFSIELLGDILTTTPDIVLQSFETLEAKYEFLYYEFGAKPDDMVDCGWHEMSLEDMVLRLEFLTRCGTFRKPHPKKPQLSVDNPSLRLFVDSVDAAFAVRAGRVTPHEFDIFKVQYRAMLERNRNEEIYEEFLDTDAENARQEEV